MIERLNDGQTIALEYVGFGNGTLRATMRPDMALRFLRAAMRRSVPPFAVFPGRVAS
jgi:hypothetical protein